MVNDNDLIKFVQLVTLNNPVVIKERFSKMGIAIEEGHTLETVLLNFSLISKKFVMDFLRSIPYNESANNYTTSIEFKNDLKKV